MLFEDSDVRVNKDLYKFGIVYHILWPKSIFTSPHFFEKETDGEWICAHWNNAESVTAHSHKSMRTYMYAHTYVHVHVHVYPRMYARVYVRVYAHYILWETDRLHWY